MPSFLQPVIYKAATMLTASIISITGFSGPSGVKIVPPPGKILTVAVETAAPKNVSTTIPESTATTSKVAALKPAPAKNQTSEKATVPQTFQKPVVDKKIAAAPAISAGALTGEQFLSRTSFSLRQRLDGLYWFKFKTDLTGVGSDKTKTSYEWDPAEKTIGGDGAVPQFAVSFSCAPYYEEPPPAIYSPIAFRIRTTYSCNVVLTDSKGRTSQKKIDFTTGPGIFLVSQAQGLSTQLNEKVSTNGISFVNKDDNPITVTGLTFDVALTAINKEKPALIRFTDFDGKILDNYFLEAVPRDPSQPYFNSKQNIQTNFSLTIPPQSGKVVFVEAANIPHLYVDLDPAVTLVFTKITTDRSDMTMLSLPITISWSCVAKFLENEPTRMCH